MAEFEARNIAFFSQDVKTLADQLASGMVLAIPKTTTKLRVVKAEAFSRERVGIRYKNWGIEDLTPGDLWSPPSRRIMQSLVISRDETGIGACVRVLSAEYWDPLTERFVDRFITGGQEFKTGKEGDIARYFGLNCFEKSNLRFLDDSNALYVVRNGQSYKRERIKAVVTVSPKDANHQLQLLLDSG